MPVAEELFGPFLEMYRALPEDQKSQTQFLAKRRPELRLLLDSVWEQTVFNILKVKPRNHLEARRFINEADLGALPPHDATILRSVLVVLNEYDVFVDKAYVDYSKRISGMVLTTIRRMCLELAAHPLLKPSALAQQLTCVLTGTK